MSSLLIKEIIRETASAKTFLLEATEPSVLAYKAGQFLTLVFNTRFGEKRRSYSISSSPDVAEAFSITVKKVENGEFSRLLNSHAKPGDLLMSSGISGLFCLPHQIEAFGQFFFFAAGSGITPCFSLIKTLLATSDKQVVLIYSNRDETETIFYQSLKRLQVQYKDRFQIQFLFSSHQDIYSSRLSNWLVQRFLNLLLLPKRDHTLFYLCGPFDYMQMITISLLSEGISAQHIRKENFNTLPRTELLLPTDKASHRVTIHFNHQVYQIKVQYPFSILSVAKSAGIAIPYSCEAGRCGSCVATCTRGEIWMAYNEVLMDEEISQGRILCCQSFPVGGDAEIVV